MIKIENLNYSVDGLKLFNDAKINIPKDKMTILCGLNGVGKTTLLKIISGIIKTKESKIIKNYKELFYLPQKIAYPQGLTLVEYIESSFYKKGWKWFISNDEKRKIDEILELLELTNRKNVLIENLSSGELQKANIALGLVSEAQLLLFDEPISNMDLINQIKVLDIIKKLTTKNITCVVVLHDINLSANYGDYFVGLTRENGIIQDYKNEFFTAENLKKVYGIDFKIINNDEKFYIQMFN